MRSVVQSVLFDKTIWDINDAIHWLIDRGFETDDVDIKRKYIHFRQYDPEQFKRLRTKKTPDGIDFIIGFY